jgi:hypothetical protein
MTKSPQVKQGQAMEALVLLVLLTAIGYWVYLHGKRTGSRKGFHAGLVRGRRPPPRRRRP